MNRIGHFIGGLVVEGRSGRYGPVYDPATGLQLSVVDYASDEEVDEAVASAKAAFGPWRMTSLSKRTEILFAMRNLVAAHAGELAALVTAEHGKVLSDAGGEVARGLENLEFACGAPVLLRGSFSEQVSRGVDVYSVNQPLGVMAGVTPFNFPAMVPMWMFSTAIACGNCFVLKPSEKDPSASLLLAELWQRAGLPDGVFNVVQGDRLAVERLVAHPDVAGISFVGSTPVARAIYETGTRFGKRVQALGGAKNHMIVLPDADVELAADAAVSAGYGSAGERCMAISVIVAVGAVADPLVEAISARIEKITIGAGDDPASEMGPLITREHRDRVASFLEPEALGGAEVVVDGRGAIEGSDGFFLGPSLIDHVLPGSPVYDEEIFGPVLSVVRTDSLDAALEIVNANPYGNGAAIFTRDGGAVRRFQVDVTVGMIGVNVSIPVPVSYYSFGGWKSSLFGDTHIYGPEGIRFCTRAKVVTTRWLDATKSAVDLGFPQNR